MPQTAADVNRELENERRKRLGAAADADSASEINKGDLGAASRKAKGIKEAPLDVPGPVAEPTKPSAGASLGDLAAYNKRMRDYKSRQSMGGMSAGSQAKAMQ